MKRKKLRIILAIMALLCLGTSASAQLTIPGTNVTFRLNNEDWRYLRTYELSDGGDVYLYCYVGHVVVDLEGDTILPFLRILTYKYYDGDLYEFIYDRYEQQPYQSVMEFSKGDGIPSGGGLGYMGAYTNPADQKDYQFYMTYFVNNNTSVEFRLETTKDTFEDMDFEFKDILSSIK